jgi:hypothetical protein
VFAATIVLGSSAWADGPNNDQKSAADLTAGLQTNRAVMAEVLGASACLQSWARKVAEDELASVAAAKPAQAEAKQQVLRATLYQLDEIAVADKARLSHLPDLEPLGCSDPGVIALMSCKKAEWARQKKAATKKRSSPAAACSAPKIRLELPLLFDTMGATSAPARRR